MRIERKELFLKKWAQYFGSAELPITFYLSPGDGGAAPMPPAKGHSCLICELGRVRRGESLCYNAAALACGGAKRFLGYAPEMRPGFEYFLSCGKPGMEGERYVKTPEMVLQSMKEQDASPVGHRNFSFKRWDALTAADDPEVVIFFAKPDVLSGLFTLATFDQVERNGTFTPFGAGCASTVYYPYLEKDAARPRAVIGMFDPSARPCVGPEILTFALPLRRFESMIDNMDESFLITKTWKTVLKRI
jgi:uncharacterized protein (DUF169 family)